PRWQTQFAKGQVNSGLRFPGTAKALLGAPEALDATHEPDSPRLGVFGVLRAVPHWSWASERQCLPSRCFPRHGLAAARAMVEYPAPSPRRRPQPNRTRSTKLFE